MQRRELNLLTLFVVFLSAYHVIARVGLAIDIQWHTDIGRDKLLTPPHMMIFSGIIPTLVFLGGYIFWFSFIRENNAGGYNFSIFSAPIPIWVIFAGMVTLLLGGLYDDLWHANYGVDTTIITPPHLWTFSGGMIVELATVILAIYLLRQKGSNQVILKSSIMFSMWALVYHLHIAFANFLDPRVWMIEILGIELIPHFVFAGGTLLIMLPLTKSIVGERGVIALAAMMLASQLLLLVSVPELVALMMGPEHVYRPGSPNTVWAAHCLPWLLFVGVLIVNRFSSFDNPWSMIALVIIVDAAWLPNLILHIPVEAGAINTLISVGLTVVILYYVWQLNPHIIDAVQNLSKDYTGGKTTNSAVSTSIVAGVCILLLVPTVSAHAIHFTEEGEGFDAPKRFLIDVDDNYLWVEFMIWPPKASAETQVVVYAHDNETDQIDEVWTELIYPTDKGDITMVGDLANPGGYQLWQGGVLFPFAGNQTLQIWTDVNNTQSFTEIPIIVDSPTLLPVWLAWLVGLLWPTLIIAYWWRVSKRID